MDGAQYARRLASRLPTILQDGENINRLFLALGTELARMDRETTLLMRSRWYALARGWSPAEKQRDTLMATELGRIGALYGLDPSGDETSDQFRKHLFEYVAIHRSGLVAATGIIHLVALEYRAEGLPEVTWEGDKAIGTFRVRDGSERKDIRVELVDAPPTQNSVHRLGAATRENILLSNTGLDPVVPEITLTAINDNEVAVPVLSHEETGLRVMF